MAAERTTSDTSERTEGMGKALKRRGLMAGAAALVAGIAAKQTSQPVAAQTQDFSFLAEGGGPVAFFNLTSPGATYANGVEVYGTGVGVYGRAEPSTNATGVQGDGAGTGIGVLGNGGGTSGIGVKGVGGAPNGIGVQGNGTGAAPGVYGASSGDATTKGVQGQHTGNGSGVYGSAGAGGVGVVGDAGTTGVMGRGGGDTTANATGFPIGVWGSVPNSGYAVYGNAGVGYGVYGNAPGGVGVGGVGGTGVMGTSSANSTSKGVYGHHTSNGYGVYGDAGDGGYGVTGVATTAYGVVGQSNSGTGVLGGIGGSAPNATGVHGDNRSSGAGGIGVYGSSTGGYGVLGTSSKVGFAGISGITSTANVPAFAGGSSTPSALAARFNGGVYVDCTTVGGGQFVVNPMTAKSGLLKHPDGSHRLMYSVEAPESWAEDFGEASLVGGKAEVKIDPEFAPLIQPGYHVFVTGHDELSEGLVVTSRGVSSFTVKERKGGATSGTFSWRLVAKPKVDNHTATRLAKYDLPAPLHMPTADELPKVSPLPGKTP